MSPISWVFTHCELHSKALANPNPIITKKKRQYPINKSMTHFLISNFKEWEDPLNDPKDENTSHQNSSTEGGRYVFKKIDKRFHGSD
jgi:hypothetical protein